MWTHRLLWRQTGWEPQSVPPQRTPSSSLHLSPRESEAGSGRTCCISLQRGETLVSFSRVEIKHIEVLIVWLYLLWRQTGGDTGSPEGCSCCSALMGDQGNVWKNKRNIKSNDATKQHFLKITCFSFTYCRNFASDIFSRALTTAMRVNTDYKRR